MRECMRLVKRSLSVIPWSSHSGENSAELHWHVPGGMKAITIQSLFCLYLKHLQRKAAVAYLFSLAMVFSSYMASRKGGGGKLGAQCENFGLEVTVSSGE